MQDCKLGLFQAASLAGGVQDSQSTSGGVLCVFGSRTLFQFPGCARNNLWNLAFQKNALRNESIWTVQCSTRYVRTTHKAIGRLFDHLCVNSHSMEVSGVFARHSSTI